MVRTTPARRSERLHFVAGASERSRHEVEFMEGVVPALEVRPDMAGCAGARRTAAGLVIMVALVGMVMTVGCATVAPRTAAAPPVAAPSAVPRQASWADAILYFVILDRYADGDEANDVAVDPSRPGYFHGGDLAGLIARLDDIADLGVTALWVTPVVDNIDHAVTGAGFPDYAYHGYWADDFYALDERFGTEDELKALVEACHARGIAVLLDVVYNHAGYESRYATEERFQPWVRVYGECGDDDVTSCVAGLPDFRTELPAVRDYLMGAHLGLAVRVGLDGFRLDTVKHVEHDFWLEHRRRVDAELGPGFFLLGEVWGGDPDVLDPYFSDDELDAGFDFTFAGSVEAWLEGRGRTVAFSRYLERRHRTREGYLLAHYLSSHDVPTAPYVLGGDWQAYRLAVALQLTSTGIPVLYYGEEVGRLGGEWPANRSDYPWGDLGVRPGAGIPRDDALRADVSRLVALRRGHPALSRGSYRALSTDGDLLVFERADSASGDRVLVAVNRGSQAASASLELGDGWAGREMYDEWNGSEAVSRDGRVALSVAPRALVLIVAR